MNASGVAASAAFVIVFAVGAGRIVRDAIRVGPRAHRLTAAARLRRLSVATAVAVLPLLVLAEVVLPTGMWLAALYVPASAAAVLWAASVILQWVERRTEDRHREALGLVTRRRLWRPATVATVTAAVGFTVMVLTIASMPYVLAWLARLRYGDLDHLDAGQAEALNKNLAAAVQLWVIGEAVLVLAVVVAAVLLHRRQRRRHTVEDRRITEADRSAAAAV